MAHNKYYISHEIKTHIACIFFLFTTRVNTCLSAIIRFGFCHCFSVTLLFPQKTLCFVRFSYFYFHCALFHFLLCFACFRSVCLTSQGHRTVQGFDRSYLKGKNKTFQVSVISVHLTQLNQTKGYIPETCSQTIQTTTLLGFHCLL